MHNSCRVTKVKDQTMAEENKTEIRKCSKSKNNSNKKNVNINKGVKVEMSTMSLLSFLFEVRKKICFTRL